MEEVKVVVSGQMQNLYDTFKESTEFKRKRNEEFIGFSGCKLPNKQLWHLPGLLKMLPPKPQPAKPQDPRSKLELDKCSPLM